MPHIANRLRDAWDAHRRKVPSATKRQLADFAEVTPQAVNGWFRTGRISKPNLVAFSRFVGADLEALASEVSLVETAAEEWPDPNRTPTTMGENILTFAKANGKTVDELAETLGMSVEHLETWIYYEVELVDARLLIRMAELLGTNPEYLLGDTDDARVQHFIDIREAQLLNAFRDLPETQRELLMKTVTAWHEQLETEPTTSSPFRFPPKGKPVPTS
jgi:transcriptional regulator with XRE-family HTH domain